MLGENKHYLISSRLRSLLAENTIHSVGELIKHLESGRKPGLRERIIDAMTTNETLWFRDTQPYETLKNLILPELSQQRARQIRIWSAACSSGQEPYSISMTVQEYLLSKPGSLPGGVQIIATDISSSMLNEANAGIYDSVSLARGLSLPRQRQFFHAKGDKWEINNEIKGRVTFKEWNLMKPYAALGKFDVIFCRNVLIYFSSELKTDIFNRMAQALNPKGYLMLGASESMVGYNDAFDMVRHASGVVYQLKK